MSENDGWIDLNKVTVFIGDQGSGKSTIAKLISTFSWMEKGLIRGDYQSKNFTAYSRFRKIYCAYHRIENYFFDADNNDTANFEYIGEIYHFKYQNAKLSIERHNPQDGVLTQVMYIPAERNFVSAVKNYGDFKELSPSLNDFASEFTTARKNLKEPVGLPINNVVVEYDSLNDIVNIKGEDYKVRLSEASSGFQSVAPLYLVSNYYASLVYNESKSGNRDMSSDEVSRFKEIFSAIWENDELSEEQRRAALSVITRKFNKQALINIVEEPEQNLFPTSQKEILYSLLRFNNLNSGNRLVLTTHSPYVINYLTVAIQANNVNDCIEKTDNTGLKDELFKHVGQGALLNAENLAIYELNGGMVSVLETYKGLPSDENVLNATLDESNH